MIRLIIPVLNSDDGGRTTGHGDRKDKIMTWRDNGKLGTMDQGRKKKALP